MKIVRSAKLPDHRAGVTNCPHCDFTPPMFEKGDTWAKAATTLILDEVHGKHGSLAVISECPTCFKKSWVHQPFSFFEDYHEMYPEDWQKAATKEYDRRHLESVRALSQSLCIGCDHLRKVKVDTHVVVDCTLGRPDTERLQYCFTTTECKHFKKYVPPKP